MAIGLVSRNSYLWGLENRTWNFVSGLLRLGLEHRGGGVFINYGPSEHSVAILAEGNMDHMISQDDQGFYRVGSNSISGTAVGRRGEGEVIEKF